MADQLMADELMADELTAVRFDQTMGRPIDASSTEVPSDDVPSDDVPSDGSALQRARRGGDQAGSLTSPCATASRWRTRPSTDTVASAELPEATVA